MNNLDPHSMPIPLNDLSRLAPSEFNILADLVREVIKSGSFVLGEQVSLFEQNFSEYLNVKFLIGVASGTDALELALRAAGIRFGDKVVTVANAGGYSTAAILKVGGTPIYADVEPLHLLMNFDSLNEILDKYEKEVKAIIVTHLYGNALNTEIFRKFCDERNVLLIEDCSQSVGSKIDGKSVGSFGHFSTFSFFPTKNLSGLGDGGAVATSEIDYAVKLKLLRQYGWKHKYEVVLPGGLNSRLDEIQATILNYRIRVFEEEILLRKKILERYRNAIENTPALSTWKNGEENSAHLAVIQVPNRQKFTENMKNIGISTGVHYPILDTDQIGWSKIFGKQKKLETSESSVNKIVTLPLFSKMTELEIDRVCEGLCSINFY